MRYAQILMGWKDSGKSTYCKLMAKYAESRGRKMRIVNLDPKPGELEYDLPIADIRDVLKEDELAAGSDDSSLEKALEYVIKNPDWLFGSIGELKDGDYILFDCPGDSCYSKAMKVFATMLVVKNFRTCGIYVKDARMCLNGYHFISACLSPLSSYISLSIPHAGLLMKVDLLSDEEKSKLQVFINSDIRDVLRYENAKAKTSPNSPGQAESSKAHSSAVTILEGHAMVRKKFYALDIKEEDSFKGFLDSVDDLLGIISEDD